MDKLLLAESNLMKFYLTHLYKRDTDLSPQDLSTLRELQSECLKYRTKDDLIILNNAHRINSERVF